MARVEEDSMSEREEQRASRERSPTFLSWTRLGSNGGRDVGPLLFVLAMLAIGCGSPAPLYRPAYVDPRLGDAADEALAEWHVATQWRYPWRSIIFQVSDAMPDRRAGQTSRIGDDGLHYRVQIHPSVTGENLHCVLLHELGHVADLVIEPGAMDPKHYHGSAPSVMRPTYDNCARELGMPELLAFERQYPR